jgi:hypothetical protein
MKNPFTIGFNNKSPLNQYKSSMPQSFDLPTLGESYTNPKMVDNTELLKEEMNIGAAIIDAGKVIAEAAGENVARKRKKEQTALDEEKKKQDAINKIPKGSFAHKTLDPDGYETYNNAMNELEEEREIERKENVRKSILKEYQVPDFANMTFTTDDLHQKDNETEADWLAKDKKKHPWDYHLGFPVVR